MQIPSIVSGFSYGVDCHGVFIRDREVLHDGVFVIAYHFGEAERHFMDQRTAYRKDLYTVIASINNGFVFDVRNKTLFKSRFSAVHTDIDNQEHIHCATSFNEVITAVNYLPALVDMVPLNPEGGMDKIRQSCIEFQIANNSFSHQICEVSCTDHGMYPFCECCYAVGLPISNTVSTFQVYMHLLSSAPLHPTYKCTTLCEKFEEFVDLYDDILHDVFKSFNDKFEINIPRCISICSCSSYLPDQYIFQHWDRAIMSRVHIQRKSDGAKAYVDLLQDQLVLLPTNVKYKLTYTLEYLPSSGPVHFKTFVGFSLRDVNVADNYTICPLNYTDTPERICRYVDNRWEYMPHSHNRSGFIYRPDRFCDFAQVIIHNCQ